MASHLSRLLFQTYNRCCRFLSSVLIKEVACLCCIRDQKQELWVRGILSPAIVNFNSQPSILTTRPCFYIFLLLPSLDCNIPTSGNASTFSLLLYDKNPKRRIGCNLCIHTWNMLIFCKSIESHRRLN
ncbi:hypothetical protein BDZ91DRAFT_419983 [Kalaharituber pfeilii]|nr:hypothetical protein BDZ91DRAFT_419983 [Kalaharituber pfeilii]